MVSMEVQRKVKAGEGRDFAVGVTSGPRTTAQVPAYTGQELSEALGPTRAEMDELFRSWRERQRAEQSSP